MITKFWSIILLFATVYVEINAQQLKISGSVHDEYKNKILAFANIRVLNTNYFTAANQDGNFEILLTKGDYKLIASHVGFTSDTIQIVLNSMNQTCDFKLQRSAVIFPEITIFSGENPAIEIIKFAIKKKMERDSQLNSYDFEGYTKIIVKTVEDLSLTRRGSNTNFSPSLGKSDSLPLKISGIIENQSKGFYKKPGKYKEIINARKQTSNLPSAINLLTGGRFIQNFYSDNIQFFDRELIGPLANNALEYYNFKLTDYIAMDNRTLFRISIEPKQENDPGFEGDIFIIDKTFDLAKVELSINKAANTGGFFTKIILNQQYFPFGADKLYMPVDYHLSAAMNFMGLARFGFELNASLNNYNINSNLNNDFFDKAVIKVDVDADKKDSTYWSQIQKIPASYEETHAVKRIDSLSTISKTFLDDFSILNTSYSISNNVSISAPLSMYHYNRIEGHTIDFNVNASNLLNERFSSYLNLSNGFSDSKFKKELSGTFRLGDYRTTTLQFSFYDKMKTLFGSGRSYTELTKTISSVFFKYEFTDYYYSNGFKMNLTGEITPVIIGNFGFTNATDNIALVNSNSSIFNKDRSFPSNLAIYETKLNYFTAGIRFDFRDYIEDGMYRRRLSESGGNFFLSLGLDYSRKDFINSGLDFTNYRLSINGNFKTFRDLDLSFRLNGNYNTGTIPIQMLQTIPGNIEITSGDYTFRTVGLNEYFGDRTATLFIEQDFKDQIFRTLQIPVLKNLGLSLAGFLNLAYCDISDESKNILPKDIKLFKSIFAEAGFGISLPPYPIQLDFGFKLNKLGENNFRIGLNSQIGL